MNPCKVDGCPSPVSGRGFCGAHYQKALRRGELHLHPAKPRLEGLCEADGCEKKKFAGVHCQLHYTRWKRHGDPLLSKRMSLKHGFAMTDRFERNVDRTDTCWLWTGHLNDKGYGTMTGDVEKHVYAHRWSYEHYVAEIPEGLVIDHLCITPSCVNPKHLEVVTPGENTRRHFAYLRGEWETPFVQRLLEPQPDQRRKKGQA